MSAYNAFDKSRIQFKFFIKKIVVLNLSNVEKIKRKDM